MSTFIRFVTKEWDPSSLVRQGLFQKANELVKGPDLFEYQRKELRRILDWFNKNLEEPVSLARSKKPRAQKKAVSWFRDTAREHIAKMQDMVVILNEIGIHVEMIKTSNPGYIVYEDEFQIVAEHFNDTGA